METALEEIHINKSSPHAVSPKKYRVPHPSLQFKLDSLDHTETFGPTRALEQRRVDFGSARDLHIYRSHLSVYTPKYNFKLPAYCGWRKVAKQSFPRGR